MEKGRTEALPPPAKVFHVSKHRAPSQSPLYAPSATPFIYLCLFSFFPLPLTLGFKVLSFTRLYPVSLSEPLASTGRKSLPWEGAKKLWVPNRVQLSP